MVYCRRATGRLAEDLVVPVISTTCNTCEAVAMTMMTGRITEQLAGHTKTFYLTSSSLKINVTESLSEQASRISSSAFYIIQ